MDLPPHIVEQIRQEWHEAGPSRTKTVVLQKWCMLLGCSYSTLSKLMKTGRKRRKGDRKIINIEAICCIVYRIKKTPPAHRGEIATEDAIEIAIGNGLIPRDMRGKRSTIDRVAREIGLSCHKKRVRRFQAERPNQLHHVDASTSDCFYVHRLLPDGDCVLRTHKGVKHYKNKPIPTRLRPWIYGLTDDHSGVHVARYVAAEGESAADNLGFMQWAWSRCPEKEFFGLPEEIKGDLGPMMRGPIARDFFDRLGVHINPSIPGNKGSHGKIERTWRTMWGRFERPYYVEEKNFEILMSELNRHFLNYQDRYNRRPHRYEKSVPKIDIWRRINYYGGAVAIPEDAIAAIARRSQRKVGADGCFSLDGKVYEVKGLHDAEVYVYQGVFENKLVVENKGTGEKYEVEDFSPIPWARSRQRRRPRTRRRSRRRKMFL